MPYIRLCYNPYSTKPYNFIDEITEAWCENSRPERGEWPVLAEFAEPVEHELLASWSHAASGLRAIVAIHSTALGPAIGGCRMQPYPTLADAASDVLRLSRGMTYKTAIANIPYGGGKAVIIGDPDRDKTPELLLAMADFVQSLGGRYITSFDAGTGLEDVLVMAQQTDFVAGFEGDNENASASTALGVFACMKAAARAQLGDRCLRGVRVAIQGLGNVGSRLASLLAQEGANLIVADIDPAKAAFWAGNTGASLAHPDEILFADVDIIAPCALGSAVQLAGIDRIKARIIVGSANNQLLHDDVAVALHRSGILYCPDYLVNAGGIVNLHYQRSNWSRPNVDRHVLSLAETLEQVIDEAQLEDLPPLAIANKVAERRIAAARERAQ